jgi:hypothetical protein
MYSRRNWRGVKHRSERHPVQTAADRDTGTQLGVLAAVIGVGALLLLMIALLIRGSGRPLELGLCALLVVAGALLIGVKAERIWRGRNPSRR